MQQTIETAAVGRVRKGSEVSHHREHSQTGGRLGGQGLWEAGGGYGQVLQGPADC